MSSDPASLALKYLTQRKDADLSPPLGHPGGRCHVIERIEDNVHNPALRKDLVDQVETADEIDVQESSKIYVPDKEKGVEGTRFTSLVILPHAQYRMDLRGISVPEIRASIRSFWDQYSVSKSRGQAKSLEQDMMTHEPLNWSDKRLGVTLVFKVLDREVRIITVYQTGVSDPRPVPEDSCKVGSEDKEAGGARILYHVGKRPPRPVPGRHGPWVRPWLKEPVEEAVFLTDNPAEVWRIDKDSNLSIGLGNLYVYSVPEWVIKAAGGLHRWQGASSGISLVKEILITPELWGEVTFRGSVPPSKWREEKYALPQAMARKTKGFPALYGIAPGEKNPDWRELEKKPRWRGLLNTSRPEDAVRAMIPQEKVEMQRILEEYISGLKGAISSSRKKSDADEALLRKPHTPEERKRVLWMVSQDAHRRLDWASYVGDAQKALGILLGTKPEVPPEVEKEFAKITQWPNPWARKHPDGETIEKENWSLQVHPWSPDQLKYKHPPGVPGLVKDEPLPKKQVDLLPYYQREQKRLPGKLEKEIWIPLSPSTTGGRDYLQVSLYRGKDFMGRAATKREAGFCPLRSEMYGGLPSHGDFESIKELGVGLALTFEAAHCVLGSLGRNLGQSRDQWAQMVKIEAGHLKEEVGLIEKFVLEYSGDIYIQQLFDFADYKPEYKERARLNAQRQVDDIKEKAPKLRARAQEMSNSLAREDLPEPVYHFARSTYRVVTSLCEAALEGVQEWPLRLENPFAHPEVRRWVSQTKKDLAEVLAWGKALRVQNLGNLLAAEAVKKAMQNYVNPTGESSRQDEPLKFSPREPREIGNFSSNAPDTTVPSRTLSQPGEDYGHPYNLDYETPSGGRTFQGRSSDPCSDMSHSFAWISPGGRVHEIQTVHEDWAEKFVQTPAEEPAYQKWRETADPYARGPSSYLLNQGWLRVTNSTNIQCDYAPASWNPRVRDAVLELLSGCALRRGWDPEEKKIRLEVYGRLLTPTVADFFDQYGDASQQEALYEGLMAQRVVAAWHQEWKPGRRQRRQRGRAKIDSHKYYVRHRSTILRKQRMRQRKVRNNPSRIRSEKRRRTQNRRRIGAVLMSPDIAFTLGPDYLLGYVHGVSPMTGQVTVELDDPSSLASLFSMPLKDFFHEAILLEEDDLQRFLNLVDVEIGPEAYGELDPDDLLEDLTGDEEPE